MSWRRWKIGLIAAVISTLIDGLIVSFADPTVVTEFKKKIIPISVGLFVILLKAIGMFLKDHPIEQITDETQVIRKEDVK